MIKNIKMGFDVSTKKVGYCITINDKPITYDWHGLSKFPSFGSLRLIGSKEYENYGNRACKGTHNFISSFQHAIFSILNAFSQEVNHLTLESIDIAIELSYIPNKRNLTTTVKLALYVGKISQIITDMVYAKLGRHWDKVNFKFVMPTEWQAIYDKTYSKHVLNVKELWKEKARTLLIANNQLGLWNFENTQDDDLADAINICMVADKVRDNLKIKTENTFKAKSLMSKAKLINRLEKRKIELESKAQKIYWAKVDKLIAQDKQEQAKNLGHESRILLLAKRERERYFAIKNELSELQGFKKLCCPDHNNNECYN